MWLDKLDPEIVILIYQSKTVDLPNYVPNHGNEASKYLTYNKKL